MIGVISLLCFESHLCSTSEFSTFGLETRHWSGCERVLSVSMVVYGSATTSPISSKRTVYSWDPAIPNGTFRCFQPPICACDLVLSPFEL